MEFAGYDITRLLPNQKKVYEIYFRHFAMRLAERYKIFITFEEYVALCKIKSKHLIRPEVIPPSEHQAGCVKCFILMGETHILVYKSQFPLHPLLTALPLKNSDRIFLQTIQNQTIMLKQFMVVSYPKNGNGQVTQLNPMHTDYSDAFEVFNGHIAMETQQQVKQPKGEKPLRFALKDEIVELWVINRTTDLITN